MKREFLKAIDGLTDEVIDIIMAENGKDVEKEKSKITEIQEKYNAVVKEKANLETKVLELQNSAADADKIKKELETLKDQIEKDKKAAEAKILADKEEAEFSKRFENVLSENTKFVNDLTKEGIYNKFKDAAKSDEYKGKGDKDIFEALTKDVEGIFANPNPPQMPKPGMTIVGDLDDVRARSIMGLPQKK